MKVEKRETGKSASRRLRSVGKAPAILYGEKIEPLPLAVNVRDLVFLFRKSAGGSMIVKLEIEGEKGGHTVLIKEIQRHPARRSYVHIDFQKIAMDEKIHAFVPLKIFGEALGVKEGGVLQHVLWEVEVEALPKDLPDRIEVDVGELNIGDTVRVLDLPQIEGLGILTNSEEIVLSIVPPTVIKEVEEVAEEVEEAVEPEVIGEKKVEEEKVEKEEK